jgi:6-phosphogluconolactonase
VPPDDEDSNYAMVAAALLDHVPAVAHRMEGERPDHAAAAADYAAALPDALDAMLLGMGEDLHTCSLFPGTDWSRPVGKKVIYVADSPKPPPERLTVTPDVLAAARALIVAVTGAGKAEQVVRALEGPERPDRYPVHLARRGTWLLDTAAAAKLEETPHG